MDQYKQVVSEPNHTLFSAGGLVIEVVWRNNFLCS